MIMEDGSNIVPLISSDLNNSKRRSIFLVKLTDSSRSTLDHLLKKVSFKSSSADFGSVEIGENEGCIRFGESTGTTTTEYKFSIADMHSELAKGQLQTTRQRGDLNPVESLGQITQRLKILASDKETFESTKQKALQEMEEAKKQSDKITSVKLKPPGSSKFSQQKWQKVATASPIPRPLTPLSGVGGSSGHGGGGSKPTGKTVTPPGSSSSAAATTAKFGELSKKSLRQRIIQHLALRPCTPAILLAKLTKEGLLDEDKSSFELYLNDVAQPKPQSNGEMELRSVSWTEVRTDWPHYNKYDAEVVKKSVAAKKLTQNNSNSSSSLAKGVDNTMFKKDELMGKSRVVPPPPSTAAAAAATAATNSNSISGQSSGSPFSAASMSPSSYSSPLDQIIPDPEQGRRRTALKRRNQSTSLSSVASNKNGEILPPPAKELALEKGKCVNSEITVSGLVESFKKSSESSSKSVNKNVVVNGRISNGIPSSAASSSSSSSLPNTAQNRNTVKGAVSKEERRKKERDRTQNEMKHTSPVNNVTNNNNEDINAKSTDINQTTAATDDVDYLKMFPPIRSPEERRRYKDLFDRDYNQYMDAYNKLHDVAIEFEKLGERLDKLVDKESTEYKSIEKEIYIKYTKFERDPIMIRCKTDHERLRSKLAVLKERVKEYDES